MATSTTTQRVLIVGAGVTGLSIARGLTRAGIACTVYERDESLAVRGRDWNMGFHWAVPHMKELLGEEAWKEVLSTVQVDLDTPPTEADHLDFVHGASGEVLNGIPVPYFHRLRRSALRQYLTQGLDVRYGKTLSSVDFVSDPTSVTIEFTDGQSATGTLLIGADGPRSQVRTLLLDSAAAPSPLPFVATYVQAKYTREQALFLRSFHPLYLCGIHPDNKVCFLGLQHVPDTSAPETWTFFFYISFARSVAEQQDSRTWPPATHLVQAKAMAQTFCEPWKSAFAWLPDDHPVWQIHFSEWDPRASQHVWDTHGGRVTLAGDAAHVMTVQRGQGLNHAIADAAGLVEAIVRAREDSEVDGTSGADANVDATAVDAIALYEKEMKARAGEEVRQCTVNSEMMHDWKRFAQSPVMQKGMNKG